MSGAISVERSLPEAFTSGGPTNAIIYSDASRSAFNVELQHDGLIAWCWMNREGLERLRDAINTVLVSSDG